MCTIDGSVGCRGGGMNHAYRLRDYQSELVNKTLDGFPQDRSIILQLPTGGGKTICFSHIINRTIEHGLKCLILAHRVELIHQAVDKVEAITNEPVGIIKAGYRPDYSRLVQVASVQSLTRRLQHCPDFDLIVVDEAHHATAKSYRSILNHFPNARVLGVTATPCRLDGTGFRDLFSRLITGVTTRQLIEMGSLSPYKYFASDRAMSLVGVKKKGGDYKPSDVEKANPIGGLAGDIVKSYRDYMGGKQAVIFCVSVEYSIAIAAHFRAAEIKAAHLDGDSSSQERADTMERFKSGKIQVLSNCGLFDEGLDIPGLDGVILARPTASLSRFLQMVGRTLRVAEGKENAIVIDLAGNYERHGLPCDRRNWTLDGVEVTKRTKTKLKRNQETGEVEEVEINLTPTGLQMVEVRAVSPEKLGIWFGVVDKIIENQIAEGQRSSWCWAKLLESPTKPPIEAWQYLGQNLGYHPGWAKYKVDEWVLPIATIVEEAEDDDDDSLDLEDSYEFIDDYWSQILDRLNPVTRDLFKLFGQLESIDDNRVTIRMKSKTMKLLATGKIPELARVLGEERNRTMSIELIAD